MKLPDLLRYGIWGVLAATADANRREYHMSTTWLPHLITNSITLLLPDVLRLLIPSKRKPSNLVEDVMDEMVRDNPKYVVYVAPLAAGYILSHPKFNIFKGDMGDIRVAGLGLDAIPHSATGFALTVLVQDTLQTAAELEPTNKSLFTQFVRWCNEHPSLATFGVLAALTFIWEYGEYRVHNHELELQGGDISKINMMWSADDTARDVIANFLGWSAARLIGRR
ncbi:MAG: hypothetical protein GC179_07030 [Anaerolineaceae bacterium]|nr:hypothetical protein [Anaerolineaceae bacterium]